MDTMERTTMVMERKKRGRPKGSITTGISDSVKKTNRLNRERLRGKSRIYIGAELKRWEAIKEITGIHTNSGMAKLLLDSYEAFQTYIMNHKDVGHMSLSQSQSSTTPGTTGTAPAQVASATPGTTGTAPAQVASASTDPSPSKAAPAKSCDSGLHISGFSPLKYMPKPTTATTMHTAGTTKRALDKQVDVEQNTVKDGIFGLKLPLQISVDNTRLEDEGGVEDDVIQQNFDLTFGASEGACPSEISLEELEFGIEPDISGVEGSGNSDGVTRINDSGEVDRLTKDEVCFAYLHPLLLLAKLNIPDVCYKEKDCLKPVIIHQRFIGSALYFEWVCANNHFIYKWCSQPLLDKGLHGGDLMCASAILASDNNFAKIALFGQFLNLHLPSRSAYHRMQTAYIVPTIERFWDCNEDQVFADLDAQDFNLSGALMPNNNGTSMDKQVFNKKMKRSSAVAMKVKRDHKHIPEIMNLIVRSRLEDPARLCRNVVYTPNDLRCLSSGSAPVPPPPSQALLGDQFSRMK